MPQNPIIALWCHPRSMSTAIERVMRERGDCTCYHEPFLYDYYVNRAIRDIPHFEPDDSRPADYDDIWRVLLGASESGPVFFKDMSYYVVPRIFDTPDLAKQIVNAFLIRNPRRSIVSYYRLDPELTLEEIGLEAQWQHYTWLSQIMSQPPIVLEAEQIQSNPQGVIGQFWSQVGLSPSPQAFDWEHSETPEGWQEVAGWHGAVTSSTGIKPVDGQGDADTRFAKVAAEAPHLKEFLDHQLRYYDLLKARSIQIEPFE